MQNSPNFSLSLLTFTLLTPALAQQQPAPPTPGQGAPKAATPPKPFATIGGFTISGQLRARVENWDWFNAPPFDSNDTFTGTQIRLNALKTGKTTDFGLDLQETILTGVEPNSIAPLPAGALGFPGNYRAANGGQDGALSVKQAFVRFKNFAGTGSSVRVGRFEFNDGLETTSKDATLNWLKTQRISQRLIGTFGYTHTGRAFDGAQFVLNQPTGNFTGVVARPTEGVFQLEANDNIDSTGFLYGTYTKPMKGAEARVFGMLYKDDRDAPKSVKTDNRALATRVADRDEINVYTIGANYLKTLEMSGGKVDLLAWGALQGGDWGVQKHSANAIALEAGYQPKNLKMKPWFRVGYFRSSGDTNPTDNEHGTFFSALPTPRTYARFPFFNQMNSQDAFAQIVLRPNPKLNLRAEYHNLRLSSGSDLWYAGGGAFTDSGFGYAGRPANGARQLAQLFDISADYALNPKTSIGLYLGYANGGRVIAQAYPAGQSGRLAFVEVTRKF